MLSQYSGSCMTQRKDEKYHFLELQPLIAVIKHLYWKGKCNYFGKKRRWSTRASEFFLVEHSNLQLIDIFMYVACCAPGSQEDSCLKVSCLIYRAIMEWHFLPQNRARVLNKKILQRTRSSEVLISAIPSIKRLLVY